MAATDLTTPTPLPVPGQLELDLRATPNTKTKVARLRATTARRPPKGSTPGAVSGPSPDTLDGLPLMLTVAEAAIVLRVSRTTAYKLAEEWRTSGGRSGLPVVQLGRRLVVRRVDLATLVGVPPSGAQ